MPPASPPALPPVPTPPGPGGPLPPAPPPVPPGSRALERCGRQLRRQGRKLCLKNCGGPGPCCFCRTTGQGTCLPDHQCHGSLQGQHCFDACIGNGVVACAGKRVKVTVTATVIAFREVIALASDFRMNYGITLSATYYADCEVPPPVPLPPATWDISCNGNVQFTGGQPIALQALSVQNQPIPASVMSTLPLIPATPPFMLFSLIAGGAGLGTGTPNLPGYFGMATEVFTQWAGIPFNQQHISPGDYYTNTLIAEGIIEALGNPVSPLPNDSLLWCYPQCSGGYTRIINPGPFPFGTHDVQWSNVQSSGSGTTSIDCTFQTAFQAAPNTINRSTQWIASHTVEVLEPCTPDTMPKTDPRVAALTNEAHHPCSGCGG